MTICLLDNGVIALQGNCSIDDAEPLLRQLLEAPEAQLDWSQCRTAHLAVVQVILVSGRPVRGPPQSQFLSDFVAPLFVGLATNQKFSTALG